LLHGFDGVLVKPHANRPSHVHVLWDSTVIDSEANDAESHKARSGPLGCTQPGRSESGPAALLRHPGMWIPPGHGRVQDSKGRV
jgi:hypothetical protein